MLFINNTIYYYRYVGVEWLAHTWLWVAVATLTCSFAAFPVGNLLFDSLQLTHHKWGISCAILLFFLARVIMKQIFYMS